MVTTKERFKYHSVSCKDFLFCLFLIYYCFKGSLKRDFRLQAFFMDPHGYPIWAIFIKNHMAQWDTQGSGRNWFMKKTRRRKSLVRFPWKGLSVRNEIKMQELLLCLAVNILYHDQHSTSQDFFVSFMYLMVSFSSLSKSGGQPAL